MTAPPPEVARAVASVLGGPGDAIESATALTGGCIHPAAGVRTRSGLTAFVKWSPDPGPSGFGVEGRGLEALAERGGLRTPRVLAVEEGNPDRRGWLALELVDEGPEGPDTAERFGTGLSHLHRPLPPEAPPGWPEDGWIGPLPQRNRLDPTSSGADDRTPGGGAPLEWHTFWREARILPQWRRAYDRLDGGTRRNGEVLLDRIDEALEGWEVEGLSLLHGDLWSGNVLTDRAGDPVLIDPAVYRGHREVDLAMMELFGGFRPGALEAYAEGAPLAPEYGKVRRDVYQLYPLLVHVNLFGGGYVSGVRRCVDRVLTTLG